MIDDRESKVMPKINPDLDAIVVGAGFGGIQILWELNQLGLSAKLIEEAADVGGTWYWNRYPGARTDSHSWVYCFSFSEELCREWNWTERYPSQPEVLAYLRYVTDRFDLRRDIQFNTRVESVIFDESTSIWAVTNNRGETLTTRFVVLATGVLSRPLSPTFAGLESFKGEWYMTSRWPEAPVDFRGKSVGVIGVGSTGVQIVPVVAEDADIVTVFQRTPNYVIEAANRPLSETERLSIKDRYNEVWTQTKIHPIGAAFELPSVALKDLAPAEQQRLLEMGWERGGMLLFAQFTDVRTDLDANEVACEFIRGKIRQIVKDPRTADLLSPRAYPFGGRRPPLGHGYYEAFNRHNVALVDISKNQIKEITSRGIRTTASEYNLDMIIFALGFDASTGAALAINVHGRDGRSLRERWAGGPRTYLGCCVDGFPNLFMVGGPQSPFANFPVVLDASARFISLAIRHILDHHLVYLEATTAAVEEWGAECDTLLGASPVLTKGERSFFLGANVAGKPRGAYFYFGTFPEYLRRVESVVDCGFEGFVSTTPAS